MNAIDSTTAARMFREDPAYRNQAIFRSRAWATANPSDPFAFTRALNDHRTGLAYAGAPTFEGYRIEFQRVEREVERNDGSKLRWHIEVPQNLARP